MGLLAGFVTKEDADAVFYSNDVPVIGGNSLSSTLKAEDMDLGPNSEDGWWFHFAFEATIGPHILSP
jgi:hypothetical protein